MSIYTDAEANQKWCPFSRVMNIKGEGGGNRWDGSEGIHDVPNKSWCLGSSCAAWRWYSNPEHGEARLGYCGLAGDLRHAS